MRGGCGCHNRFNLRAVRLCKSARTELVPCSSYAAGQGFKQFRSERGDDSTSAHSHTDSARGFRPGWIPACGNSPSSFVTGFSRVGGGHQERSSIGRYGASPQPVAVTVGENPGRRLCCALLVCITSQTGG
jgi:hypothetical protein